MGDFVFCYGLHNKNRLSKYIKQTKKGCKLYFDNENYINVKIETRSNQKYIIVDFNDSLDFMKFIVKKKFIVMNTNMIVSLSVYTMII